MRILVINPGSTSTKIAVYEDEKPILLHSITHSADDLAVYDAITEQQDFRRNLVIKELHRANIPVKFDAVIGRGGLVKPIAGGVYEINEQMLNDTLHGCVMHNHACNLGCLIAHEIAITIPNCRAFIADPGVVDELSLLARISGSPLMPRICIWHALNQRAIARRYAREIGKRYEDLNLIICHLGGGISVAAHEHGKAIDTAVSASSQIRETKILSTMLYSACTSMEIIIGTAIDSSSLFSGIVPILFSRRVSSGISSLLKVSANKVKRHECLL